MENNDIIIKNLYDLKNNNSFYLDGILGMDGFNLKLYFKKLILIFFRFSLKKKSSIK